MTPDDAIPPISDEDRALLRGLIRDASALRVNDPEHRWVLALDARLTAETRRREEAEKERDERFPADEYYKNLDDVLDQRDAAQREVERLREALTDCWYISNDGEPYCPRCGNHKSCGHHPDCEIRAALAVTPTTTTTETKKETGNGL